MRPNQLESWQTYFVLRQVKMKREPIPYSLADAIVFTFDTCFFVGAAIYKLYDYLH